IPNLGFPEFESGHLIDFSIKAQLSKSVASTIPPCPRKLDLNPLDVNPLDMNPFVYCTINWGICTTSFCVASQSRGGDRPSLAQSLPTKNAALTTGKR
ncbi:MAG TPA: hypothetical protein V6D34_16880, partial [Candidatus Sericytochromatia bacterium]